MQQWLKTIISDHNLIFWYMIGINALGALIVFYDKIASMSRALRHFRVPQAVFVVISVIGGGIGTYFAMAISHQKTRRHNVLLGLVASFAVVWIFAWILILV